MRPRLEAGSDGSGGRDPSGAVRTAGGDVYAGRDGNVYRKGDGGWQQYDNGNWGSVDKPQREAGAGTTATRDRAGQAGPTASSTSTAQGRDRSGAAGPPAPSTMDQLNRDSRARSEGTQRTRDYSSYSGGRSSGSSYRSSGGSYRGGGGRGGGGRRR